MARRKGPPPARVVDEAVEIPDDPLPPPVPAEALAVSPAARERARLAVVLLQHAGPPCEACGRGLPEDVTPSTLRGLARLGPRDSSLMARLFNAGALPPFAWSWRTEPGAGQDGASVVDKARSARTVEELEEVAGLVSGTMASGELDVARGKALIQLIGERRKMATLRREVASDGEAERFLLPISEDAERLVAVLDRLVSDESRKKLLDYAAGLLEEDVLREPNKDAAVNGETK